MSDYLNLMEAIGNYYGVGSDQWVAIHTRGILADNAYNILRQTPGVTTIVSKSGDLIGYTVDDTVSLVTQPVGSAINSNAQTALTAEQSIVRYPAQMSVDAQTGEMVATSGMKTVSTGAKATTAVAKVATAVGAVACGVQLGAIIDGALYNANPDFWDEHGMSNLNPETWDSMCTTEGGKDFFNFVFGIDKDTGTTQAYVDENTLAYIAAYMSYMGAFSTGDSEWDEEQPQSFRLTSPIYSSQETFVNTGGAYEWTNLYVGQVDGGSSGVLKCGVKRSYNGLPYDLPADAKVTSYSVNDRLYFIFSTKRAQVRDTISASAYREDGNHVASVSIRDLSSYTYDNKTVYYWAGNFSATSFPVIDDLNTNPVNNSYPAQLAWMLQYGNFIDAPTVEGISPQEGATLPTGITSTMTIPEVLQYLKTTYPDLWDDAIENDVIQPDGSIKKYTYVPTAIPDNIPVDQITGQLQPTGGVDMKQDNRVVSPTSPEEIQGTLSDIIASPNPYNPTNRIEGDYVDTGEGDTPPVVIPTGSVDALYSIYNPTQAQVNSFGAWLWSPDFVDQLKKLFNDPMQSIIGLHKVFATPATSGTGTIHVGYLDSQVGSKLVSDQYTEVDCGSISLYEYFGNALDYINTDIYLYLPFVGIVPLNVDDVMRSTIGVKYKVDVLTGACLASVNVSRDGAGGQLYTYSGNCAVQYPLSSGSYMGIVASIAGIAGAVVGTIATGGAMLPVAIGAGASALSGSKTKVEHSGSLSGNAGAMGIKKPYLIIRRPQTAIADNFDVFKGVSNNEFVLLGSCSGYTQIRYVNLENFAGATKEELYEIENLLESGIII